MFYIYYFNKLPKLTNFQITLTLSNLNFLSFQHKLLTLLHVVVHCFFHCSAQNRTHVYNVFCLFYFSKQLSCNRWAGYKMLKARLHSRFLSWQLETIFVALKLQLQNRMCKPGTIFSAISHRNIKGVSNMHET